MSVGAGPAPGASARALTAPRSLRLNASLALLADLAAKAGGLVVLVVAARLLPPAELAALGVALAAATVLTTALDAGASVLLARDGAADAAEGAALMRAGWKARVPMIGLAVLAAGGVGLGVGRPAVALLAAALAGAGAGALTLLGVVRAGQDLRPEARSRTAAALAGIALATALMLLQPTAEAALAGLVAAALVGLVPLWPAARRLPVPAAPRSARTALRASAPLGAIGLVTLAYYRAPTLLLGALAPALETATFTVAATVGFGLLAVPNAVTTGLLPRLASEAPAGRAAQARRALGWTALVAAGVAAAAAAAGPWALPAAFGDDYRDAAAPLAVLALAVPVIGASGILGTALIAEGRVRPVAWQVTLALTVNLTACAVLIPRAGALGAAWATLATELAALAMLAVATRRHLPAVLARRHAAPRDGGFRRGLPRPAALPVAVCAGIAALLALAVAAGRQSYGLRVISDAPTFLAVIRQLAIAPLEPVRPFLDADGGETSHASPYMQALAWLWRSTGPEVGADGHPLPDPEGLGALLAGVGVLTFGAMVLAVALWTRRLAGARAAWWSVPALLLVLGPAHVIWAGDHSFHALLYAGYFPQNLALALLLGTLLAVEGRGRTRLAAAVVMCAAALLVHPFTGVLLAGLLTTRGGLAASRRRAGWWRPPATLAAGFALGSLWPASSLDRALGESGIRGIGLVALACAAPGVFRLLPRRAGAPGGLVRSVRTLARDPRLAVGLGVAGVLLVVGLAAWAWWLSTQPHPDPLIESNRLAVYWVEDRWRWPLMLGAGALGLVGLARLARRGHDLPGLWLAGALGIGLLGMAGLPVPVWWRFLLFCQVPLAIGLAVVLAGERRLVRGLGVSALAATLVAKLAFLVAAPATVTYFDTTLQDAWRLGSVVPAGSGLVASDPYTSYFVPATTGRRVLVVTKAHVGSRAELAAAEDGYRLLHRFVTGDDWWEAGQEMYRRGVRHILIDKTTLLRAPTLERFSTGLTPLVRTGADRQLLGTYFWRAGRVGRLVSDGDPYVVYELERSKLWPRE